MRRSDRQIGKLSVALTLWARCCCRFLPVISAMHSELRAAIMRHAVSDRGVRRERIRGGTRRNRWKSSCNASVEAPRRLEPDRDPPELVSAKPIKGFISGQNEL